MAQSQQTADFIVVGMEKSGTTSLKHYLMEHPLVSFPERELHYFDQEPFDPQKKDQYIQRVWAEHGSKAIIGGEKTPRYAITPDAPERIAALFPETKLVWMFRNPVDRAYSNYFQMLELGYEYRGFEYAIRHEVQRMKENVRYGYLHGSCYSLHLKRYLQHFPIEQMHFILFEDFVHHPQRELNKLFSFLGLRQVDSYYPSKTSKAKNKTIVPRFPFLFYALRKLTRGNITSIKLWGFLWWAARYRKAPSYKKLSPERKQELATYFHPYNDELRELTGLDLSHWT